jgi:hypothetical protein
VDITITENLVFAPSLDGRIRVFDARGEFAAGDAFIVLEVKP